jgi:hypothetical protein
MRPPRDRVAAVAIPVAIVVLHLLTWRQYGIFRDELYYLACASHLDWGYVDHPPLSIAILAGVRALFGESLFAMRAAVALVAGGVAFLTGDLARALGGGSFAQRLAALSASMAPGVVALCGFYSMNAFDLLFWTACARVLASIVSGGDPRLWLAFGALAGLGLQNKISVSFLGFGVAFGIVAALRFDLLRTRWIWLGAAIALALFLPHLVWQVAWDAPTLEFMRNARERKMATLSPFAFLGEVALSAGPGTVVVLLSGLVLLLRERAWRVLGLAFAAVLALLIVSGGKPYYAIAAYPIAFAAGGVALERWAPRAWARGVVVAVVITGGAVAAPLAKGFLPAETFVAYARTLGVMPSSGERSRLGRLPQHFADMHGWKELAETVARVHATLPEGDKVCVAGQNYGQAGAIDHFGPALGIPPAVSTHNSYWIWGADRCADAVWIVIGDDRENLERLFESVERAATFDCDLCMPYEDDNPIWVCRRPKVDLKAMWPRMKHFI